MYNGVKPPTSHEAADDTIRRAAAQGTDPLTLLETEDALSAIPNNELMQFKGYAWSQMKDSP